MYNLPLGYLIEEYTRSKLQEKHPELSVFSSRNDWIIQQIESLLEEYPILKTLNYQELSANDLLRIITTQIKYVEVISHENNDVLVVFSEPTSPFLSRKDLILIILLCIVSDFSICHFIFNTKKLDCIDCQDHEAFFYLHESSAIFKNEDKNQYHLISSLKTLMSYLYLYEQPNKVISKLNNFNNIFNGCSIAECIDKQNNKQNIDDEKLKNYLTKRPENIDINKIRKNKRKLRP